MNKLCVTITNKNKLQTQVLHKKSIFLCVKKEKL